MSFFDIEEPALRQMFRYLPRLFALVSKRTLKSFAWLEVTYEEELRIMVESAKTNGHCSCYARLLDLQVDPDHQQDGLGLGDLLLRWLIQAAEQEGVPVCADTSSSDLWMWEDLSMDSGAEEVDMVKGPLSIVDWTGDAADSEKLPKPEEDGTAGFKFIVWAAPKDSEHSRED